MKNIEFDRSKLRGRIKEILGSEQIYQKKMNFSDHKRNSRLNGETYFNQDEIIKSCEILLIEPKDIPDYFFTKIVR